MSIFGGGQCHDSYYFGASTEKTKSKLLDKVFDLKGVLVLDGDMTLV